MNNYLKGQILGLFWFIVVYALVRSLIAGPLFIQNWDTLAIVVAVSALMWLIIRIFYSEKKGFGLASSLFPASIAVLYAVTVISDLYVQVSVITMAVVSLLVFIILGIRLSRRKDGNAADYWLIATGRLILTLAMIFVIETWLLPLIPML